MELTSNQLKLTACAAMLCDHAAYVFLREVQPADYILSCIGRLSFVLFAYLIAEGYFRTSNKWRYLGRLLIFAVLSEIPFDLAFSHTVFNPEEQNVFLTLALGLLAVILADEAAKRFGKMTPRGIALQALSIGACAAAAYFLRTDYDAMGVLLIAACFYFHYSLPAMAVSFIVLTAVFMGNSNEYFGAAAFLLIAMYHGKKGSEKAKYAFYAFYPAHLLIIGLLEML